MIMSVSDRVFVPLATPVLYRMHADIDPVTYQDWVKKIGRWETHVQEGSWVVIVAKLGTKYVNGLAYDTLFMHEGRFLVAVFLDLVKVINECA